MLYRNVDQMISFGDLRIFHGAGQTHIGAVLELITAELGSQDTRILRVVRPACGQLGLAELITQLAGHPPSRTALARMPTDGEVERAHHLLTTLDKGCDRILLLIEGAPSLQPAALRYIQQVCRTTPHLRLAWVGSDTPALLFEAEFAALSHRAATELRLDERAVNAEACLTSALSSTVAFADTAPETASVDAKALSRMVPGWTMSGPLPAAVRHRLGWFGRISMVVLGLVAAIGIAAWLFRDGGIEVKADVMAASGRATQPLPTEPPADAAPPKSSEHVSGDEPAEKPVDAVMEVAGADMPEPDRPPVSSRPDGPPAAAVLLEPPSEPSLATVVQRPVPAAGDNSVPAPAGPIPDNQGPSPSPTPSVLPAADPASAESSVRTPEAASQPQDVPASARALATDAQPDTLIPATEAPPTPPASPVAATPSPVTTEVSRADHLLATGDISGARRWYEYAAGKGSAIAATSLGKTYDPVVLSQWHRVGGVVAEPEKARFWYEKGVAMGDPAAAASLALLDAGH